jgi:hypothetical protein
MFRLTILATLRERIVTEKHLVSKYLFLSRVHNICAILDQWLTEGVVWGFKPLPKFRNFDKVPKIKKILLYEMKFLVPNYSCLQNP